LITGLHILKVNMRWPSHLRLKALQMTEKLLRQLLRLGSTTMRESKRKKLESKGWKLGNAKDLLGLSVQEEMYIELRLKLAEGLKARRRASGVTQVKLAKSIKSSQSRVAKMEAGDPTVSLDLLVKSILALGASNRELAAIIARR
jgi:DNA-binding XRE family transcriptional regulator